MIVGGKNGTNIRIDFPKRVVRQLDDSFLAILVNVPSVELLMRQRSKLAIVTSRRCAVHSSATGGRQAT